MKNQKLLALVECATMLALSFVLNLVVIWQMPLGGKVTLASMLPVMLIGIKWGQKYGFATTCAYGLLQTALSIAKVLSWGLSVKVLIICILFDYFVPYAMLGTVSFFRKGKTPVICVGIAISLFIRFACHFLTGITIWANWLDDSPWAIISYSLVYNGQYMLPEIILTMVVAVLLLKLPQVKKLIAPRDI